MIFSYRMLAVESLRVARIQDTSNGLGVIASKFPLGIICKINKGSNSLFIQHVTICEPFSNRREYFSIALNSHAPRAQSEKTALLTISRAPCTVANKILSWKKNTEWQEILELTKDEGHED